MTEFLFFLVGCASTLAVTLFLTTVHRRRTEQETARQRAAAVASPLQQPSLAEPERSEPDPIHTDPREAVPPIPEPQRVLSMVEMARRIGDDQDHLGAVVNSVGNELANLVSGVEGHAQILCEVVGEPDQMPICAEQLWIAVRRLRFFSEKLLSYARPASPHCEPTDVAALLTGVRQELEDHLSGAVHVELRIASALPLASTDAATVRHALLFLVDAILAVEPDASELLLTACTRLDDDDEDPLVDQAGVAPSVEIEILVGSEAPQRSREDGPADSSLGYQAARALLDRVGASMSFVHQSGMTTTAGISLPATAAASRPLPQEELEPASAGTEHPYGGAMILESDPSIRSMLSRELELNGRHTFRCTNGTAARSLFTATPNRFEVLVLEEDARGESGATLAANALAYSEDSKVLLLIHGEGRRDLSIQYPGRFLQIRKPFGLMELREALATLVGAPLHL